MAKFTTGGHQSGHFTDTLIKNMFISFVPFYSTKIQTCKPQTRILSTSPPPQHIKLKNFKFVFFGFVFYAALFIILSWLLYFSLKYYFINNHLKSPSPWNFLFQYYLSLSTQFKIVKTLSFSKIFLTYLFTVLP